ncbi:uncharacterized protein B0H18DRAFT_874492, partial [Fomitopsis serialis]|uniref:uncharacterized protein n=1 Tax=Fomitopsis serialis TaxID=139415 RepID=UPI002008AA19
HYIYRLLLQSKLHECVTFVALMLLHRAHLTGKLKRPDDPRPPPAVGHKIFLAAFIVASKIICERSYKNSVFVKWMTSERLSKALWITETDLLQLERVFCAALGWSLHVDNKILATFTRNVKSHYAGEGPYPVYAAGISSSKMPAPVSSSPSDEEVAD